MCFILRQLDENKSVQYLDWLPPRFPCNLRCIVCSTDSNIPCIARLEDRQAYFYRLEELTTDGATAVVEKYLKTFNKVRFLQCFSGFFSVHYMHQLIILE